MNRRHAVLGLALGTVLSASLFAAPARAGENTVTLETKDGRVTIELRPEIAPKHVKQLKTLISQGFYNGLKFHRVIDGFMVQTGDPKGNGTGGSSLPNIPAEFSSARSTRGTVGHGPLGRSELGQFPVLHLPRRRRVPEQQLHRRRRRHLRHGRGRQDQEGLPKANNGLGPRDPDKIVKMTLGGGQ